MDKITLLALKNFIVTIINLAPATVPEHNFPIGGTWSLCNSEQFVKIEVERAVNYG